MSRYLRQGINSFQMQRAVLSFFVVALCLMTGCVNSSQKNSTFCTPEMRVYLSPGQPVGQTFVARHSGLNGIAVWLEPGENGSGREIQLYLRSDPNTNADLTTATLSLEQVTQPGFYHFSFPARMDSDGEYFYAAFEVVGDGRLSLCTTDGESYLDGTFHRQHQPLDAQMAFQLTYAPIGVGMDLVNMAVTGVRVLIVTGLLYVVPGWVLCIWFWPKRLAWSEILGLAPGLSLTLYTLLLLWTDWVGLHGGVFYAWLPVIGGLVALGWRYRTIRGHQIWQALQQWTKSDTLWPDLTFLLVLGLVFGVRLLVIHPLDAPMWGDSYQHTMMTQLLVDNDGLFHSWLPYTPYKSLTVHFGFSLSGALLSWLTQVESVQATLLAGQIMNSLAILTLYPLGLRLADGKRWAGVGVVLVAGLLSPLPAEYVNWGRYAQLAGQTILPVAIWWSCEAIRPKSGWTPLFFAGAILAGMGLHYYRMPIYYAVFILVWLIGWGIPHWKTDIKLWSNALVRLASIAGIAGLFFAPWLLYIADGRLTDSLGAGITQVHLARDVLNSYQEWRTLHLYVPKFLQGITCLAWGWSLVRRRWAVASLGLWIIGLAALVAARLLHIPGMNLIEHFAVMIALYIPVGLLSGWLISEIVTLGQKWGKPVSSKAMSGLILIIALYFARQQTEIVKPSYVMVTRPDMRAMTWLRDNVPMDALFLVESFSIYNGRSAVGADAGWWIPLLTGRANTMPPQYALMNETPLTPGYKQQVAALVTELEAVSPTSSAGLEKLCSWGITHVYVGQAQGKVGAGVRQLFSPDALIESENFAEIYHQDRIHIFTFNQEICKTLGK